MKNKKLKLYKHALWEKPVMTPAQTKLEQKPVHTTAHMKVFLFNTNRQQQ